MYQRYSLLRREITNKSGFTSKTHVAGGVSQHANRRAFRSFQNCLSEDITWKGMMKLQTSSQNTLYFNKQNIYVGHPLGRYSRPSLGRDFNGFFGPVTDNLRKYHYGCNRSISKTGHFRMLPTHLQHTR